MQVTTSIEIKEPAIVPPQLDEDSQVNVIDRILIIPCICFHIYGLSFQEYAFVPYSQRIREFFARHPGAMKPIETLEA